MDPSTFGLLARLTKKLGTRKPTHEVLGRLRPIRPRVVHALVDFDDFVDLGVNPVGTPSD